MKLKMVVFLILILLFQNALAFEPEKEEEQTKKFRINRNLEIPFTLEDRERMIRIEEGLKYNQQQISELRSSTQQQISELRSFMLWGFGITFAGIFALIGFVIWDRRTAINPVLRKQQELEEKIERVLKEYAKVEPKLEQILRSIGML